MPIKIRSGRLKIDRPYVRKAMNHYTDILGITEHRDNIIVEFTEKNDQRTLGYADTDLIVTINYHFYPDILLNTIAHEFIHVKQYISGQLKYTNKHVLWENEIFLSNDELNHHKSDYEKYKNLPWEKEAFANSKSMVDSFLKLNNERSTY